MTKESREVNLKIYEDFKSLIPPLTDQEYSQLEKSILAEGCRDALVVWKGTILDGHNRYRICKQHGVKFKIIQREFVDRAAAKMWIMENQIARRNLTAWQRGQLAAEYEKLLKPVARERQREAGRRHGRGQPEKVCKTFYKAIQADRTAARTFGLSHTTLARIKKIQDIATAEQKQKLENREASVNEIYKQIQTRERHHERIERLKQIASREIDPLSSLGKFNIIYADPPWRHEHCYTDSRRVDNKYPTMSYQDLAELDIDSITADDCVLFMWSPSPKLDEALQLIREWGFAYRTSFVWIKPSVGMGIYGRLRHELLLISRRGNIPVPLPENRPDSVIEAPRKEHSRKPVQVYETIERMYPDLPKIELFARNSRPGWACWGYEAPPVDRQTEPCYHGQG
jgi:N6-adenosine-specific RNA methylase IME4